MLLPITVQHSRSYLNLYYKMIIIKTVVYFILTVFGLHVKLLVRKRLWFESIDL